MLLGWLDALARHKELTRNYSSRLIGISLRIFQSKYIYEVKVPGSEGWYSWFAQMAATSRDLGQSMINNIFLRIYMRLKMY